MRELFFTIIGFATCYWLMSLCNHPQPCDPAKDTQVLHDTTLVSVVTGSQIPYTPIVKSVTIARVEKQAPGNDRKPKLSTDTLDWSDLVLHSDTTPREIVSYADTIPLKYGFVSVNDTLEGNRIRKRSFKEVQDIPLIRETKVITKQASGLYFGVDFFGNPKDIINGAGACLLWQMKNRKGIELGASILSSQLVYKLSYKFSLTK